MSDQRHDISLAGVGLRDGNIRPAGGEPPRKSSVRPQGPSLIPSTLTAGLALLYLALIPAAQFLHIGCQHTHSHHNCGSGSCSRLHVQRARLRQRRSSCAPTHQAPGTPRHRPHDPDTCGVCQVLFCASLPAADHVRLIGIDLIAPLPALSRCRSAGHHCFRPPARGPPSCCHV